jgi:hypothetical protein
MTLDGFLTVLALLAAIYAVLPAVQRLRLSLAWKAQALLGTIAITVILALELYEVRPTCPAMLGGLCSWLILPEGEIGAPRKVAFLVAFAWLILAVLIHNRSRPSLGSIPGFTQLAFELIDEEQFGDALKLLESRMDLLARASWRRCWQQRLHDWLEEFGPTDPNSFAALARRPGERKFSGETWPSWAARPVRLLARVVPDYRRAETAASDMLQMLFNSSKLLAYIAERRPYFGLPLIRHQVYGAADFCERYLARLMAAPGSALYHEVATNLTSDGPVAFHLPARNRLLHFLFADARHADRLSAWKGVGGYIDRLLDGKERADYWDWLNGDQAWFEEEQFRDPVFIGILFFDIMVRSAAHQNLLGHMWLYYLRTFARGLEARYDSSGEGIDRDAEFPVRAARLLYEITQIVTGWVELFENLPEDSIHRRFPERRDSPGSIPHAAALALGDILATAANSDRIDRGVRQTLHDVILRTIRNIHDDGGELARMRAWLIEALLNGGNTADRDGYYNRLADLLADTDYMLRHEVEDYTAALQRRMDGEDAA